MGAGTSVKWPVGLGGKGNEGVTGLVKQTPGAIGYVELAYAKQNKLPMAALQNKDGDWVKPTMEATSVAAAGVAMPDDFRVSITDAAGQGRLPDGLLHLPARPAGPAGRGARARRWWSSSGGRCTTARSSPRRSTTRRCPQAVVKKVEAKLKTLTAKGQHIPVGGAH